MIYDFYIVLQAILHHKYVPMGALVKYLKAIWL